MRSARRWVLACAVLAGSLLGTDLAVLGATEVERFGTGEEREYVASEQERTRSSGEDARLEQWSRVARRPRVKSTNPIRLSARGWIRIFQRFISPVDGASCSYHPNCSTYGLQAIEEHGLLIGVPMTAERVMRNHRPENPERYPLYEQGGDLYYWDPVKEKVKGQRAKAKERKGKEVGGQGSGVRGQPLPPRPK